MTHTNSFFGKSNGGFSTSIYFYSMNTDINESCFEGSVPDGSILNVYGYDGSSVQEYLNQLNNSNIIFNLLDE